MEAKEFEQQNVVFGKDQPEYLPLPAFVNENESTFCFKLSEQEIKQINESGEIWLTVLNFKQPLQPINQSILNPFKQQ